MISALQGMMMGAVLAILAVLGITIFIQHEKLNAAQTHAEQQAEENAALRVENDRWKRMADRQNQKITALAAAETRQKAALMKAAKIADAKTAPLLALANKINLQPIPAGDDCAAARGFMNLYLAGQK